MNVTISIKYVASIKINEIYPLRPPVDPYVVIIYDHEGIIYTVSTIPNKILNIILAQYIVPFFDSAGIGPVRDIHYYVFNICIIPYY